MAFRPQTSSATALLGLLILGATTGTAHAYLDPGTGTMILHILLGGIAGMVVMLKLNWYKVKVLFGRRGAKDTALENDALPPPHDR